MAQKQTKAPVKANKPKKTWIIWLIVVAAFFVISVPVTVIGIRAFFFQPFYVNGHSMEPTYKNNDYLIIDKLAKKDPPARGQVVVYQYQQGTFFIKRVIALPGDRVVIKGGQLTVTDPEHPAGYDPLPDYGVAHGVIEGDVDMIVPAGTVYVLGDNLNPGSSYDSRETGPVKYSDIIGIAGPVLLPVK